MASLGKHREIIRIELRIAEVEKESEERIKAELERTEAQKYRTEHTVECIDSWLNPTDSYEWFEKARGARMPDTGQWLFKEQKYINWLERRAKNFFSAMVMGERKTRLWEDCDVPLCNTLVDAAIVKRTGGMFLRPVRMVIEPQILFSSFFRLHLRRQV
ncbi:hypothetical protein BDZ45DRAFT_694169 [Acephala macrosclerotiorum]|nr:hypothetical protein BDZ45DRAFT_694169 [Acephala macrosclerotiorum]